jgi:hypothetical protein
MLPYGVDIKELVHIKMKRALTILLLTFVSCGHVSNKPVNNITVKDNYDIKLTPFELTVEDADYSMSHTFIYKFSDKKMEIFSRSDLNIVGMRKGENIDTVYESDLKCNETLKKLSNINLDSLQAGYFNHCIMDGSQVTVKLNKNNKSKTVYLSNYYQADIGQTIELINSLTPEKYKIWYDKETLLKKLENCKK